MWFNQSVNKLVRFGYRRDEVGELNLLQFVITLDAIEQISADERIGTVIDLSTVVAGAFASKGNPIQSHVDTLQGIADGDSSGNPK